ncbi:hypothetical protein ACFYOK_16275 [Microbispora bryophytorum]|uniref:hypothetical protein n=1 Tax=Microbispora bryophytorum TaxID=1460882 RepID=UPI0033D01DB2
MDTAADLSHIPFWGLPRAERHEAFRRLRALDQPVFFRENKIPFIGHGPGYRVAGQCSGLRAGGEGPRGRAAKA